ncbi:PfkB family carbohydrate kinase [Massilia sp. W12]|uniref:carbohydrate kinase family protein n=1 Tax=Massilia sp. W12 TaxID=3126507 RepID=UPI0030D42010
MPGKTFDLLVIGGAGIDTIVPLPALPLALADSTHVEPILDYVAHTGNGVALGALAAGLRVKFLDLIGADQAGAMIRARHAACGLDAEYALAPAGTRRSVNLVDKQGRRQSLYDGRETPGQRLPDALLQAALPHAHHVHVSIMDWARHVLPAARAAEVFISTDLHDWDGVAQHHWDFALQADGVFVSGTRLGANEAALAAQIFQHGQAQWLIVMDGAHGSRAWLREQAHAPLRQAALPPPGAVIDSNGAGDSYVAAFIAARLRGLALSDCMRIGARAGAYACTRAGTHEAFLNPWLAAE